LETLLENYFKLSIIFLKNFFEKDQVSKYFFPFFIQTYQAILQRDIYKIVYKVLYAKGMFEKYISKKLFL
jgi:hypothetical protein